MTKNPRKELFMIDLQEERTVPMHGVLAFIQATGTPQRWQNEVQFRRGSWRCQWARRQIQCPGNRFLASISIKGMSWPIGVNRASNRLLDGFPIGKGFNSLVRGFPIGKRVLQ